jgi:signal transduction histidine kinase
MRRGDGESRLLALISHEMRAPLGVLSGYLKLLGREPGLSERHQTLVQNALNAGEKLHGLLGELRELLQLEAGDLRLERRAIPLQTLVTDVVTASAAWPEAPTLVVGPLPNVVLQVDRPRMTAALAALARAAARPFGHGATISCHGTLEDAPRVRLTIGRDDAAGDVTPAAPLDESRGGLGLAIPLARAIVTAHGGTITEQVAPPGAPTFTIVLATTA